MEKLNLSEIIGACHGSFGYPADIEISGISTDTRTIEKNSLFIALKGERFDGHDFAAKAMEMGAAAVVTERAVEGARCVIVDSTAQALLDIAGYYRSRFDIPVVGVTGSVGKTTTKDMIALVVSQKYNTLKTQGNLNNEIGMPKTLFGLDRTHTAAVIEMGMSHQGEISRMSMCCQPDVCVITNIGVSHIENLGSQANILKAKMEILDGAKYDAPLILCRDDKLLAKAEVYSDRKVYYYSVSKKDCDVYATGITTADGGINFTINYGGEKLAARINCLGEHNVKNALAAFCVGIALDIPTEDIIKGIGLFKPEGMRQNVREHKGVTFILDCYNAAPDSMKASLSVLAQTEAKGKRYCVLGDMLELGKNSAKYHKQVGEYVLSSKADEILCFGENSVHYIEGACDKGFAAENARHFDSREELAAYLKGKLNAGDAVLIKGSRGMKLEEVFNILTAE
ncbi:UDP-N-acetylmuramoyl-tripeptide--D-alanyl-D-alanine ligase [uncultured Ruminococcus sp.]|uniref:UDP-N-acetylmuramoyl-tripeptide--D-alanyl-D- alanine ligase n=1 Tax=uncultured Ruminococcus sp. TaxID=165186 RepID=UPI0025E82992|nr:UDP-N-acetylmuramoyl-tripeptide--D-alanyl-D-alanine ligase [uncultured Ruminococcus sp.]